MIAGHHTMKSYDARTTLRFFAEALGAVVLLAVATLTAHRLPLEPGTTAYTIANLTPILPAWLLPLVMYRHYRRIDELQRLQLVQSIAITAGIMVGIAWSWPSIQRAFAFQMQPGMWEVHFSVIFVVVSALVQKIRNTPPRAG